MFLDLPIEIRRKIYEICFNKYLGFHVVYYKAITLVNRQIRSESITVLLKEILYFSDLRRLSSWVTEGDPALLNQVWNIELRLDQNMLREPLPIEAENTAIERASPSRLRQTMSRLRTLSVNKSRSNVEPFEAPSRHKHDILASYSLFSKIPELRSLYLDLDAPGQKAYVPDTPDDKERKEAFLTTIAASCPSLSRLTSFPGIISLDYLTYFHNLHFLRWTGYSLMDPQETLSILGSLPHLNKMSLYRYPAWNGGQWAIEQGSLEQHLSFTPYVMRNLKALKLLNIEHMTSEHTSHFLTAEMIQALAAHRESLQQISIGAHYPIDGALLGELLNILSSFRLKRVHMMLTLPIGYKERKIELNVAESVKECDVRLSLQQEGVVHTHTSCVR